MATLSTSAASIESLLRPPGVEHMPSTAGGEGSGGGGGGGGGAKGWGAWPLRFAVAAEAANRHLGPEELARTIVALSDAAWGDLESLRAAVAAELRAHGPAVTAFGQILVVEDSVWGAIARFRTEYRAGGGGDARLAAMALQAIRIAVTPPGKHRITSAAKAESADAGDPRMQEAETAVVDRRAETFLSNYRRHRAAAAARNPDLRTQKGLAAAAGVSAATVNAIETGKVLPQLGTIVKLAGAMGVSAEDLIGR